MGYEQNGKEEEEAIKSNKKRKLGTIFSGSDGSKEAVISEKKPCVDVIDLLDSEDDKDNEEEVQRNNKISRSNRSLNGDFPFVNCNF